MRRSLCPALISMEQSNATALLLKTLIPRCAFCGTDLSGHRFALIASTVAADENRHRVQALISRVMRHEWSALTDYKDFRPEQNAVSVYSIMGPHAGGMVVLIGDPFQPSEPAELYLREQLFSDEACLVAALTLPADWQNF